MDLEQGFDAIRPLVSYFCVVLGALGARAGERDAEAPGREDLVPPEQQRSAQRRDDLVRPAAEGHEALEALRVRDRGRDDRSTEREVLVDLDGIGRESDRVAAEGHPAHIEGVHVGGHAREGARSQKYCVRGGNEFAQLAWASGARADEREVDPGQRGDPLRHEGPVDPVVERPHEAHERGSAGLRKVGRSRFAPGGIAEGLGVDSVVHGRKR